MRFRLACVAAGWHLRRPKDDRDSPAFALVPEGTSPEVGLGEQCRLITVTEMLAYYPRPAEVLRRALLNLAEEFSDPYESVVLSSPRLPYLVFCRDKEIILTALSDRGYVERCDWTMDGYETRITPEGWEAIERWTAEDKNSESGTVFVAMSFAEKHEAIYDEGIKLGIEDAGYEPRIMRNIEHNNDICDAMIAEINQSRFIVADFTDNCHGAYFEAGYAKGMGLETILVVPKNALKSVHFDTNHYSHITYESNKELRRKLKARILATIGKGPEYVADLEGPSEEI